MCLVFKCWFSWPQDVKYALWTVFFRLNASMLDWLQCTFLHLVWTFCPGTVGSCSPLASLALLMLSDPLAVSEALHSSICSLHIGHWSIVIHSEMEKKLNTQYHECKANFTKAIPFCYILNITRKPPIKIQLYVLHVHWLLKYKYEIKHQGS